MLSDKLFYDFLGKEFASISWHTINLEIEMHESQHGLLENLQEHRLESQP